MRPGSIILGIDPGLDGALAFYTPSTGSLDVLDMPTLQLKKRVIDEYQFARLIDERAKDIAEAWLEQVATRPGEGAVGAFAFGRGYGFIRGVLAANFIPIRDVTPAVWKKASRLTGLPKDASRGRASELFPRHCGLFSRKKDDGRSDAVLIAHYGATHRIKEGAQ